MPDRNDEQAAHSLSRVPRVPLIVGSTLLLALLTFLTVRLLQEDARDDAAHTHGTTRSSRSSAPVRSGP